MSVSAATAATKGGFERQELEVNGTKTVIHSIGNGGPLLCLHGGGTFHGFEFAREWASGRRVILPYHPGWGESVDDPRFDSMQDYVVHYLDLLDALGLEQVDLLGISLGGWIAAEIAIVARERLRRLVLVAPAGLRVPHHPPADLFTLRPQELPSYLVENPEVLRPYLPTGHDPDFLTARYRETSSIARLMWDRPMGSAKLAHWLHRITVPTLLLWGSADRLIPAAQAEAWSKLLPNATVRVIPDAGHLVLVEKPEAARAVADFLAR